MSFVTGIVRADGPLSGPFYNHLKVTRAGYDLLLSRPMESQSSRVVTTAQYDFGTRRIASPSEHPSIATPMPCRLLHSRLMGSQSSQVVETAQSGFGTHRVVSQWENPSKVTCTACALLHSPPMGSQSSRVAVTTLSGFGTLGVA